MPRLVAIMQPTYLPWVGYFDLLDQADVFVFLDDVHFSRQSWQQRNRIRTAKGLEWLTVPVLRKGRGGQLIRDVELNARVPFAEKHLRSVSLNYGRAPHFAEHFEQFGAVLRSAAATGRLVELNISLIDWLASQFDIATRRVRSSGLGAAGERSALLLDICRRVGADAYLSPRGALTYLVEDHRLFEQGGLPVFVHSYEHPEYAQVYRPFIPFASAIDLLFAVGPESLKIIRSGRRRPFALAEAVATVGGVSESDSGAT